MFGVLLVSQDRLLKALFISFFSVNLQTLQKIRSAFFIESPELGFLSHQTRAELVDGHGCIPGAVSFGEA